MDHILILHLILCVCSCVCVCGRWWGINQNSCNDPINYGQNLKKKQKKNASAKSIFHGVEDGIKLMLHLFTAGEIS